MTSPWKSKERSAPLSIRFSDAERTRLTHLAAGKPLGQFIRERTLEGQIEPRRAIKPVLKHADDLGRLMGLLGQSRLASNLNQLAKAANQGSLPVTTELEAELRQACADIRDMRHLLLRALGMQILDAVEVLPAVADRLADASGRIAK